MHVILYNKRLGRFDKKNSLQELRNENSGTMVNTLYMKCSITSKPPPPRNCQFANSDGQYR